MYTHFTTLGLPAIKDPPFVAKFCCGLVLREIFN